MKIILLILTLILLTGCSIGENQEKEYTVTMEQVQTEIKYITSVPLLSENKLFICDFYSKCDFLMINRLDYNDHFIIGTPLLSSLDLLFDYEIKTV